MVELRKISYGQLQNGDWQVGEDAYNLASFVDANIKQTFLDNPNNDDPNKTAVLLAEEDGVVVGRFLLYPTSIKIGSKEVKSQSFGSIEVHSSQRGKGIGSMMNRWILNNDEYPLFVCSLLSSACLSIMRKKENGCTIFEFPELIKIINTESFFACRGIKGFPLSVCRTIGNFIVHILDIPNRFRLSRLKRRYVVKQEFIVPKWAGNMCTNDGHRFAEIHDNEWLQWNLSHNLSGEKQDMQSFFSVYKEEAPIAFFFIKQRLREDICVNAKISTLCEWASVDEELSEADINLLALDSIAPNSYYMRTVTDFDATEKRLYRYGFKNHGLMQMGVKVKDGGFQELKDSNQWRIRIGCCNSILY